MVADAALTEIRRGDEAKRVLENPVYQEAVQKVREGLIQAMAGSPLGDAQTHNRLVIGLQILTQIEKQLVDVMQTGRMAQIQVEDKNAFQKFFG